MFIFIPKLVCNTFLGNNSLEAEPPPSSVTFAYQHPGDMFGLTEWWMLTSSPQYPLPNINQSKYSQTELKFAGLLTLTLT